MNCNRVLVLVTLVATLASLAACSKSGGRNKTVTGTAEPSPVVAQDKAAQVKEQLPPAGPVAKVLLWHAYRDDERKALDKLVASWNEKNPRVQVTALAVPFDAYVDKLQVAVPRDNGPDLMIFAHDKIGSWARDGLIQPLGEWASAARLRRFLPQTVKPLVFERAVYGLPLAFKSLVLFYNKAMVPTAPKTMAELITIAKRHTNADESRFGLAYDATDLYQHAAFMHAYGATTYDDGRGKLAIDTPAAVEALSAVRALHKKHGILPKGVQGFVITGMFNDGSVPMVFNGPWFSSEIDAAIDWGVAVLPTAQNGNPLRPYLGSEALLLNARTKVRAAALQVVDYLTSDEAALTRLQVGKQLVANTKVYENPRWAADPVIRIFRAQADVAVPMSNAVEANVAWQPYSSALSKAIFGDSDVQEALTTADREAAAALAKLKR